MQGRSCTRFLDGISDLKSWWCVLHTPNDILVWKRILKSRWVCNLKMMSGLPYWAREFVPIFLVYQSNYATGVLEFYLSSYQLSHQNDLNTTDLGCASVIMGFLCKPPNITFQETGDCNQYPWVYFFFPNMEKDTTLVYGMWRRLSIHFDAWNELWRQDCSQYLEDERSVSENDVGACLSHVWVSCALKLKPVFRGRLRRWAQWPEC